MPGIEPQYQTFLFGAFELNPQTGELRKQGVKLKLQEQPLQILVLLLEHAGQVVTREDIQKRLWPEDTYVDFDNAINNGIRKLREVLGDSAEIPRFVETLSRRGYRFVCPVLVRPTGQAETAPRDLPGSGHSVTPCIHPTEEECDLGGKETVSQHSLLGKLGSGGTNTVYGTEDLAALAKAATPGQPGKSFFSWWKILGVASAVIALALLGLFFRHSGPPPDTALYHVTIPTPKLDLSDGGRMALSRDGRRLAFITVDESGARHLTIRSLDSDVVQTVASATDARNYPFWSPDGQSVGYFTSNSLNTVNLSGGQVRKLASTHPITRGASWGTDGQILFTCLSGPINTPCTIYAVPEFGGEPKSVTFLPTSEVPVYPVFLPDGKRFLFSVDRGVTGSEELRLGVLGRHETRLLGTIAGNVAVAAPGVLVFRRGEKLYAQRIDEKTATFRGEPVRLVDDIRYHSINGFGSFSVSETGLLAFRRGGNTKMCLRWFDRSGKLLAEIGPAGPYWSFDLSRDATRIAVSRDDETLGTGQIWIGETDRGPATRLTGSSEPETLPAWSPDGQRLCYVASRNGRSLLLVRAANGPHQERVLLDTKGRLRDPTWTPDGHSLAVVEDLLDSARILLLPVEGTSRAIPLISSETFIQRMPQFSPDGHWMAYVSTETGGPEVYVRPFPDVNFGKWAVSTGGGLQPRWRAYGQELFYVDLANRIVAVPVMAGEKTFHVGRPTRLFAANLPWSPFGRYLYAVTPDGRRILAGVQAEEEDHGIEMLIHWDTLLR